MAKKKIMNNIPDFVRQVQEVEQGLKMEWQNVQSGWKDSVAESFSEGIMQSYLQNFQQYITGDGISGFGLERLLQQMNKHAYEMESLIN